jgi:hypothetical protein
MASLFLLMVCSHAVSVPRAAEVAGAVQDRLANKGMHFFLYESKQYASIPSSGLQNASSCSCPGSVFYSCKTWEGMHKLEPSTSFGTIALFFFSSRIPLVETSFESVVCCLGGKTYQPM